jgi:hypothetical protein
MVAPPEIPRNAQQGDVQAALNSPGNRAKKRGQGQYRAFARIATTLLHAPLLWVTILLYPTASERRECMLAMLFWVLAALAVVGALAIDWGLYLLVRRWL